MSAARSFATALAAVLFITSCTRSKPPAPSAEASVYADPTLCASCHPAQAKTYRETGMGRSFTSASPAAMGKSFDGAVTYYHKASDRYYQPLRRENRFFLRRYQKNADGSEGNALEYEIHYVLGSGNHSKTYVHRDAANRLIEMPLSWYSEGGGKFAMSPGYDNPAHYDFRRKINYDCVFCHNGYPRVSEESTRAGAEPLYPLELPEGIDCQRCHGPGRAHVEAALRKTEPATLRKLITNPSRLPAERQMEVCLQCHLETTSFPLPNSIQRYGRGAFSYKPGEPLATFQLHFDHAPGQGREDKFEIASSAYRLRQSQCYLKSGGKLQCTTCHNPHDAPRGARAESHYAAVCGSCHEQTVQKLTASGRHTKRRDCAACHMPKRRTEDVVHVVMTDHKIVRRPPPGNPQAPRPERQETPGVSYRGEVVPYYPSGAAASPDEELYRASAQVLQKSNLTAGIAKLEAALRKHQPRGPEFYFDLAEAYLAAGDRASAMANYQAAIDRDAKFAPAIRGLGAALLRQNELVRATQLLEQARALDPRDAPTLQELSRAYRQQGRVTDTIAALRAAAALEPTGADIQSALGDALTAAGDTVSAENAYREAIRHQPDLATAHYGFAATLASRGLFDQALPHMEKAVALAHTLPQPHEMLGNLYARNKDWPRAALHYREALRLDPRFGRAHLGLAMATASQGDFATARKHLQEAAASPDPAISRDARELLQSLP